MGRLVTDNFACGKALLGARNCYFKNKISTASSYYYRLSVAGSREVVPYLAQSHKAIWQLPNNVLPSLLRALSS